MGARYIPGILNSLDSWLEVQAGPNLQLQLGEGRFNNVVRVYVATIRYYARSAAARAPVRVQHCHCQLCTLARQAEVLTRDRSTHLLARRVDQSSPATRRSISRILTNNRTTREIGSKCKKSRILYYLGSSTCALAQASAGNRGVPAAPFFFIAI